MEDALVLRALLTSPTTSLVGVALDGTIDLWSAGSAEMFGWTGAEILGQPLSVLVPADRQYELVGRSRVLDGEAVEVFETVRLTRDGSPVATEMHVVAVRDDDGRAVGTLGLHRDLRRALRAERELGASQSELHARFAASPVPQALVDRTGLVLTANAALADLLGCDADELMGVDGLALFTTEERPGVGATLVQLTSGAVRHAQQERTLRRGDGELRHVVITATVLGDVGIPGLLAVSVEDTTDLRSAEVRARRSAERFDDLVRTMPVVVFTYDLDGRCTSSRGQALRHFGEADDDLVGTLITETYAATPELVDAVKGSLAGEQTHAVLDLVGRVWDCRYRPVCDDADVVVGGLGIALDITERAIAEREVQANEKRLRALLREADDVVVVVDVQGRLVYVSPSTPRVLGHDDRALFWRPATELNHPEDRSIVARAWRSVLDVEGATARFTCRVLHADGSWRWCEHTISNQLTDPDIGGMVVNLRDVTAVRLVEQEMQRLALHDGLTGLANRALLLDRVGQALTWASREDTQSGLIALGLTNLGAVNEKFGHDVGDAVLRAVADRLQEAARDTDSVARLTDSRFCVLVEDLASIEDLRVRASTLLAVAQGPVEVRGLVVEVEARVASARTPAPDASALLAAAERALDEALVTPPGVALIRSAAASDGPDRYAVLELQRALRDAELRLHFQPVIALQDGSLAGVEALVRWQHPSRGLLAPSEFIPLAEESGLIVDVGAWVLREACTQMATWYAGGHSFGIGVNLSPRQMAGDGLLELVSGVLRETGARGDRLILEVTESALMDDPGAADVLRDLRRMGVRLALDDFGTGYSSLTYLKRFPVDAIKIDRSFVSGLGRDADDDAIVASVVSLGRAVGKILVAEGVETVEQLHALRALGVDQAQGYFWSPALPADELMTWNDARRPYPEPALSRGRPAQGAHEEEAAAEQILALHQQGASLHTIAAALNAEGLRTATGPRWTTTTVARVVARLSQAG